MFGQCPVCVDLIDRYAGTYRHTHEHLPGKPATEFPDAEWGVCNTCQAIWLPGPLVIRIEEEEARMKAKKKEKANNG